MAQVWDENMRRFFEVWGNRFVSQLKANLMYSYAYAPGSQGTSPELQPGNAYSNGRRAEFSGSAPKLASSKLYNSIEGNVVDGGFEMYMESYWEFVNYGRERGSYVPISPLEEWARLKGFDNPRGAAFGISKNIQKFGIAPTYFYDNAVKTLEEQLNEELIEVVDNSIETFFNNLFFIA